MKIALVGKMGSGKTTLANKLASRLDDCVVISIASKLKDIAKDLFNMKNKDRRLLQLIGMKMREIDEDVWIKYTLNNLPPNKNIIIDDCRFVNEARMLRRNGWILVKIDTPLDIRLTSLSDTRYINDISEQEVDLIDTHINVSRDVNINRLLDRCMYYTGGT